ncbi:hypothetical protein PHMEG_00019079 [Phytophthora megakarya]|uniref:PiggyBac transposable element-derived protein domain-containing protein n=1 Tax=Phytophthora megakarya TaxID=4795 RepID=A0A225VTR2_9STRA|nr:hypothetical protein PHMEG_00019079 [Phytophthora megakarya]
MVQPIRKDVAAYWSLKQVGALHTNRFHLFMPRNRIYYIIGNLHFSNNRSAKASVDRAWNIRPVADVLQRTFARGFRAPCSTRTNLTSGEPKCSSRHTLVPQDNNTGEAAVLFHRDENYFDEEIRYDQAGPEQANSQITAAMWMDRTPLLLEPTDVLTIIGRRIHGEKQSIPAPELVRDYHCSMVGVDVHDQLRMQLYTVQLCYKIRKYFKTLFLGLFDTALANVCFVFRLYKNLHDSCSNAKQRHAKH